MVTLYLRKNWEERTKINQCIGVEKIAKTILKTIPNKVLKDSKIFYIIVIKKLNKNIPLQAGSVGDTMGQ